MRRKSTAVTRPWFNRAVHYTWCALAESRLARMYLESGNERAYVKHAARKEAWLALANKNKAAIEWE